MRSLMKVFDSASHDPGLVESFCKQVFEFVCVGYVSSIDKLQIACFDHERCRLCIWYQYWPLLGTWAYDVYPGKQYKIPEEQA